MPAPDLTPEEVSAALGETAALDEPAPDPYADENGAFMAAARTAVGSETKATALKDAITACLREHGLITDVEDDELEAEGDEELDTDVGSGFDDL
jgi:hypothetical protein